jgi:hypothetical protein
MSVHEEVQVVALDKGCGLWIVIEETKCKKLCWLEGTSPENNLYETLTVFYMSLLEMLRDIDLGEPRFLDILWNR